MKHQQSSMKHPKLPNKSVDISQTNPFMSSTSKLFEKVHHKNLTEQHKILDPERDKHEIFDMRLDEVNEIYDPERYYKFHHELNKAVDTKNLTEQDHFGSGI